MLNFIKETIIFTLLLFSIHTMASDHIDGPVTKNHGVADISDLYVFTSPENINNIVFVLNVYPMVSAHGHFSEKVNYEFIIKSASLHRNQININQKDESKINCSFKTPHHKNYSVSCQTNLGLSAHAKIASKKSSGGFRLFAAMRSDPFYLNKKWVQSSINHGKLIQPNSTNVMAKLNVLSIVIEISKDKLFSSNNQELLAVAARSLTKDNNSQTWRQLDWVGRPEVTNFSLVTNNREELRDLYNNELPFANPYKLEVLYEKRLHENIINFFDKQDGRADWNSVNAKSLSKILLRDYLIIAPKLPCFHDSFLDIEMAILENKPLSTCGGRKLTDDIVDKVLSLLITARTDTLKDGVNKPYKKTSQFFPYLSKPDLSLSAKIKAWLARKFK